MMGAEKRRKQWIRWGGVAWVTLFLFWLPVEDVSLWPVLTLGGLGMAWVYTRWRFMAGGENRRWLWAAGLAGLATPMAALLLVVFKGGAHGHGFLDLPLALLIRMLLQSPVWFLAGIVFGYLGERGIEYIGRRGD